jgi:hypothetical protein
VIAFYYPTAEADLAVYRSNYCLPECTVANGCLQFSDQFGNTAPASWPTVDQGWNLEAALDIQMVSSICPYCRILLVMTKAATVDSMGNGLNRAVEKGE